MVSKHAFVQVATASLLLASQSSAQITFSVDWKGPTISQQASVTANQITEGDILSVGPGAPGFGPLPVPTVVAEGLALGLSQYAVCVGHLPGVACGVEVDAISQGLDLMLVGPLGPGGQADRVWFSVDEWARGAPTAASYATVFSEALGVDDASADIFIEFGLVAGPLPPSTGFLPHVAVFDGDGLVSAAPANHLYPGLGLIEPNPPAATLPNPGDNIDAMDIAPGLSFPAGGYYISVDAGFVDPNTQVNNSNTALAQGVSGADVLWVSVATTSPTVFAAANSLGLDLVAGPGSDDLDALILVENGTTVFEASQQPYDWTSGAHDMLLFSVRRGSAVIGQLDSIFGQPIEEGDILTTPLSAAAGGVSIFPGIFYAAETLGLVTARSHGVPRGDDLDGMDFASATCFDCNNNGVEDAVDIATGSSSDVDDNGIPDECEAITEYGQCTAALAPCGNDDASAGCANSTGEGAHLYFTGTHSVMADDLVLTSSGVPPHQLGIHYMGGASLEQPFGDGVRCVGAGATGVFRFPIRRSGSTGTLVEGPGLAAYSCAQFAPAGCISAGMTWYFQSWYRDPTGPCGGAFNLSNGIAVQFGL